MPAERLFPSADMLVYKEGTKKHRGELISFWGCQTNYKLRTTPGVALRCHNIYALNLPAPALVRIAKVMPYA